MARPTNPQESWDALLAGNARFIGGDPAHPRQDIDRVEDLADGQAPFAALFGCADSRLSAEIIFDLGLGD
ncbi:MAG: carbonic anhydrase, partial [Micrococcales bacterium]